MGSLYVHIPFCEKKCVYCDFYSIESSSTMGHFLSSLHREIDLYASYRPKATFETIFFGGGTPSLLTPDALEQVISHLASTFVVESNAEITVETNPGTVTRDKLEAYRSIGVNRLSIGIQSFHEADLKFLSRIHDAQQAIDCVELARSVGFDNLSIDLIYALPAQTLAQWEENLKRTVALNPNHISAYGLIVEENTPLIRIVQSNLVSPKPADEEAEFYKFTMDFLENAGFEHYEVSNYAKPGFRSRHNYNYWRHENYLSFGPSAHSFWRNAEGARRWFNIANLSHYCARLDEGKLPLLTEENLTVEQLRTERILLGLRSDGLDVERMKSDFPGHHSISSEGIIRDLESSGFVQFENGVVRLTTAGYLLCDDICARLMP